MLNLLKKSFNNECPNCNKGKVFQTKVFFFSPKYSKMNEFCASCHHKFQKEPGFFVGAMYVSYALGIAEVLATFFVLGLFFEKTFDLRMLPIIATVIVLLTFFNVRFSRMIWMYLFKN